MGFEGNRLNMQTLLSAIQFISFKYQSSIGTVPVPLACFIRIPVTLYMLLTVNHCAGVLVYVCGVKQNHGIGYTMGIDRRMRCLIIMDSMILCHKTTSKLSMRDTLWRNSA